MANASQKKPTKPSTDPNELQGSENGRMTSEELDKLDAVRDLLFGQNVKEYRGEFKEIKDMISSHRAEMDNFITETKAEILDTISKLDQKVDQTNKEISEKLDQLSLTKTDKESLADLFKNLASKLES